MKDPKTRKLILIGAAVTAGIAFGGVSAYLVYKQIKLVLQGLGSAIGVFTMVLMLSLVIWMFLYSSRVEKARTA